MSARSGSIVVPDWQDDSEVNECPICKRHFYFLFRKHHCRRCGRVICNECSPHRITLPRQYIVRPPHEAAAFRHELETSDGNDAENATRANPAVTGGETVRVCNPCVPDPNYGPPPQRDVGAVGQNAPLEGSRAQFQPHASSGDDVAQTSSHFHSPQRSPERSYPDRYRSTGNMMTPSQRSEGARVYYSRRSNSQNIPAHEVLDARWRTRMNRATSAAEQTRLPTVRDPPRIPPPSSRPHVIPGVAFAASPSRGQHAFGSAPPTSTFRQPRSLTADGRGQSSEFIASLQNRSPVRGRNRPAPRRPVREEDLCPVCGTHDPPFGPDGDQSQREQHIEACINTHLHFSSTPTSDRQPSTPPVEPSSSTTPASAAIAALGSSPHPGTPVAPSSTVPRSRTNAHAHQRMLVYHATEKDCSSGTSNANNDEVGANECVICLEEFEVGEEMGRLECLCKFHRSCIRGWWDSGRDRWGSCPTHALQS